MNQLTRPTRQLARPRSATRYDIVDGEYRIEPVQPTLSSAALYVAITALLLALGMLIVGYAVLLGI